MKKISLLLLMFSSVLYATEREHQVTWCETQQGIVEYKLPDATRVDCLTDHYAIEFDFAKKWAEAIGQSLYYSTITGKQAGIVLILEKPNDCRFVNRVRTTINEKDLGIQLWTTPWECKL